MAHQLVFLIVVAVLTGISEASKQLSITWNDKTNSFDLTRGRVENYIALADFSNDVNTTGWAYLEISTNPHHDDLDQAYTAGLMEGLLTSDLIKMHAHNTLGDYCNRPYTEYCVRLRDFIETNFAWMQQQIDLHAKTDPYWHQVELFLMQTQGIIDGYKYHQRSRSLLRSLRFKPDLDGLLIFQIAGDLGDLESALQPGGAHHVVGSSSCSALIKLLPGNKDLLVSQDTWEGYETMLRILKKYNLPYHMTQGSQDVVPGAMMSFSSYPGALFSGDDFYVISSGLVSLETTIGNNNASRFKMIKPEGIVLEGIRNMVANRLSASGKQWLDLFSRFNSGTYNNQWMIVDYNKFVPGETNIQDGLLSVLEQIPGMIVSADKTDILRTQTYWSSYNLAYFPEIFNASGGQEQVAKYGDWFSYENTPRAKIFRRDHMKVKDIETMTRMMRYNDYTHDPLSACNCTPPYSAENSIAARCDLNPINGTYPFGALGHRSHGATDMKLTASSMISDLEFIAISGPTFDSLPPFQWSKSDFDKSVKHMGHPDLWSFKPVQHKWKKD